LSIFSQSAVIASDSAVVPLLIDFHLHLLVDKREKIKSYVLWVFFPPWLKLLFIDASLGGSRRKACEMEKGSVRVRGKESEKGKRCNTKTWERSRIKKSSTSKERG
jgi:hypothetical protein